MSANVEVAAAPWSQSPAELFTALHSGEQGLASSDARDRLQRFGLNVLKVRRHQSAVRAFLGQFRSPLMLILVFAAVISAIAAQWADAVIVLLIVIASSILSFAQEYSASNAVARLRAQTTLKANVLRDGVATVLPAEEVVPGDVVLLSAGSVVPADGVVLTARDFFVNQSVLTGETFPVEKKPSPVEADATLSERLNMVFMGTSARSGTHTP